MNYSFKEYSRRYHNFDFWNVTDWIVGIYLDSVIDPDALYDETKLEVWEGEIYDLITPAFVVDNRLDSILDEEMESYSFADVIHCISRGLKNTELVPEDLSSDETITAFLLRMNVSQAIENLVSWGPFFDNQNRFYGRTLLERLEGYF